MKRMNFLIGMLAMALVFGMMAVGCDHGGGGGGGGDSVVYTSETSEGLMELTITKAAGNANILANTGGTPVYAVYEPKSGDSYTIKIAGVLKSSGTVTVNKASAKMTFTVAGTGATFTASVTATGGALTFSAGIKTNDGGAITVVISVETPTPPFVDEPITPPTTNPPTYTPPTYTPPVYIPPPETPVLTLLSQIAAYLESAKGGVTADDTVPLKLNINLSSATDGWEALISALTSKGKYVALDLSACSMSGTEFDLYAGAVAGKNYIVSLVLPNAATSIASSSYGHTTYNDNDARYYNNSYSKLSAISGTNVGSIGDYAFYECSSLTSVSFPEATSIGHMAFDGCTSLTTASFPNVTTIGGWAFYDCTSLTTVFIPKATSIGDGAFIYCTSLTSMDFPKATSIGGGAFISTSLTTVDFPKATSIGVNAFQNCTSLTSASFLNAMSVEGFSGCTSLTSVSIPKATSIGQEAFNGCTALISVSFPEATSIGNYAFQDCTSLTSVYVPKVTNIGYHYSFAYTGTTPLTITMGAVAPTVEWNIFEGVTGIKTVTVRVPSGATGYDEAWQNAFKGQNSINLEIEYEGQSVPAPIDTDDAFTSLSPALAYLDANTGGNSADNPVLLKLNVNLASSTDGWIALANALASRSKHIALDFSSCSMNGTTFDLYAGAVAGKNYIVSLILPDSARSIASSSSSNTTYTSDSGYSNNSYSKLGTVSGANVTNIGDYAFYYCTSLTSVSFPEATSIGSSAFLGCTSLTTLSFPEATSIGEQAFYGCTALTEVSFSEATSIGRGAFYGCTALTTASFPKVTSIGDLVFRDCLALTTVSFPEATSIGWGAFWDCKSLATVSFPKATSIGGRAFEGCTALTSVSFPEVTSIGQEAFQNSGTTPLTITMGAVAPTVDFNMFYDSIDGSKNVTVRVPSGASGYTSTWQNAFKGYGNDGGEHGTVNSNINLVVEEY